MINKKENSQYQLFESLQHGVLVTDERGHILFLNSTCSQLLGYNHSDLIGKPISILFAADQELAFKKILGLWAKKKKYAGRLFARKKSGDTIWLDIKSSEIESLPAPHPNVISICDISKLEYARNRIKKNEAISKAIFEASIDAMIIADSNGIIHSVNHSACEMFGYDDPRDMIGKSVNRLISSHASFGGASVVMDFIKKNDPEPRRLSEEIQGLKSDGSVFPIELSAAAVVQNGHTSYAGIIRDLTERRRLERRLITIGNEERVQIGRELHDGLGQMLTGIRMQAEVLHRKLKANGLPGADEVGEISQMVRDADEFTRNLSRSTVQMNLDGIDLCKNLDDLCKRVSRMSDIKCQFSAAVDSDIADDDIARHLYRIAQESITNAIKHGQPSKINVRLSASETHTVLIIEDDGAGFNGSGPEEIEKGIGIKTMKHRARVLGGVLDLTRTDDDRTRVRCIIPQSSNYN